MDENPIDFPIKSVGDQWFLIVDYSHTTHNIMLKLKTGNVPEIPAETTTLAILVVSIVSAIAIGLLLVYPKKLKRTASVH